MNHTTNLVIGDWSHDGHGKTDQVTIKSNYNSKAIEKAYKEAVKIIGFDITKCCDEFEDRSLAVEYVSLLHTAGFDIRGKTDDEPEEGSEEDYHLHSEVYAEIYLFFVGKTLPDFEYEVTHSNIDIGGYGLFNC